MPAYLSDEGNDRTIPNVISCEICFHFPSEKSEYFLRIFDTPVKSLCIHTKSLSSPGNSPLRKLERMGLSMWRYGNWGRCLLALLFFNSVLKYEHLYPSVLQRTKHSIPKPSLLAPPGANYCNGPFSQIKLNFFLKVQSTQKSSIVIGKGQIKDNSGIVVHSVRCRTLTHSKY